MQPKIHWTARADAGLRELRALGVAWETIAAALRLNRSTVIRHGLAIGARGPAPVPRPDPDLTDPARGPLPAGHPLSWPLLTAGSMLAATLYPWPPVLAEEPPPPPPSPLPSPTVRERQFCLRRTPPLPPSRGRAGVGARVAAVRARGAEATHAPSA